MSIIVKDGNAVNRTFRTRTRDGENMAVQAIEPNDKVTLASALTTGSSTAVVFGFGAGENPPGYHQLTIWGTPGTSSIKLQFSPDAGTTWIDTSISGVTSNQIIGISIVEGRYRMTVVNAGGGSSWSADLRGAV